MTKARAICILGTKLSSFSGQVGLSLVSNPVCSIYGQDLKVQSYIGGCLIENFQISALLNADDVVWGGLKLSVKRLE